MRSFRNIAALVKKKRLEHARGYSQSELSNLLGYKNGQFISNVERSLCNIPLKMLTKIANVLEIPHDELKEAILKDHDETLDMYLSTTSRKSTNKSLAKEPSDQNFIVEEVKNATPNLS